MGSKTVPIMGNTSVERMFRNMATLGMEPAIEERDGVPVLSIASKVDHHRYSQEILARRDMVGTLVAWVRLRDHEEVPCG